MKIGDIVAVIDDDIEGKVLSIKGTDVLVQTEDGFEMYFTSNQLVVIKEEVLSKSLNIRDLSQVKAQKESAGPKKSARVKPKERILPPRVIDLHIHQLVDNTKGWDNYDMLNFQVDTAKRQLELAMQQKVQRLVFIHGIGEGVLRTELEFLLNRYDNLKYYDADYKKYGRGATEVYIFQNAKKG